MVNSIHYYNKHLKYSADKELSKYHHYICKLAIVYCKKNNLMKNIDDAIQLGYLGFLEGYKRYKPNKGTKIITYATHWILAYIRYVTNESFLIKLPYNKIIEKCKHTEIKEYQEAIDNNVSYDHENNIIEKLYNNKINEIIDKKLSNEEKSIIYYYKNGLSYTDIAKNIGISRQLLQLKFNRIIKKLNYLLSKVV